MADAEQPYLRIYCVCGQKMKVTGSLFGRPGKCVACRQKIRIPRFEEIPEGTNEIHLKDHPEFLRGARRAPSVPDEPHKQRDVVVRRRDEAEVDDAHTPDEEEHVELTDTHVVSTVALDVLEPLRNLFSLGNKLQRQLETLDKDDAVYAEAKGRLVHITKVRADLEEQLRQMLMEVAIELAMTQDKIAQTQLSARIGELDFDGFRKDIYKQRSRRDQLERRQQNLRGWIATGDVRAAGGFVDVPPDAVPDDGFKVPIPAEPRTSAPLVDVHISGLRDAFEERAKAERTLAELERMRGSGKPSTEWKQSRSNAKSARMFADANIEFRRERLQQLRSDYTEDLETIAACLDMMRNRMQSGQLDRAAYDKEAKKLGRAQADLKKALSVIDRALSANSASDVPQARGTFLGRMAADEQGRAEPARIENGLAWAGAGLLALSIFLPLIGNRSPFGAFLEFDGAGSYAFLLLLAFAGLTAGTLFVRDPRARMLMLAATWILGLFVAALIVREALYSVGPVSARFRTLPPLAVRPGFLALIGAAIALAASIALGMRRVGWWPLGFAAVAAAGLALLVLAASDFAGIYRPAPRLAVEVKDLSEGPGRFVQISVANEGGRAMYLLNSASDARAAYQLFVERRTGANSWSEVPASAFQGVGRVPVERIGSGEALVKTLSVESGDYRALLVSKARNFRSEVPFSIQAPPEQPSLPGAIETEGVELDVSAAPPPGERPVAEAPAPIVLEPEPVDTDELEPVDAPAEEALPQLEIAFQGAGARGENQYRLSFVVRSPEGLVQRIFVSLDDEVTDGWRAAAYDPGTSRVTLTRDEERLTLAPGQSARFTR